VTGITPSITISHGNGKSASYSLLEVDQTVLDFVVVTDSPFASDYQVDFFNTSLVLRLIIFL